MQNEKFTADYFEHNGFNEIDETLIKAGQSLAEKSFNSAPFKALKTNCVIVFKQNNNLYAQMKRDYDSAIRQAKKLMEEGINSIIYIFTKYPDIVKHQIVTNSPLEIPDYEGRGKTFIKDVRDLK